MSSPKRGGWKGAKTGQKKNGYAHDAWLLTKRAGRPKQVWATDHWTKEQSNAEMVLPTAE